MLLIIVDIAYNCSEPCDGWCQYFRFPALSLSTAIIIVYFPIGLVLAIFRMFIGLQAFCAACVLPKTSLLRRFVCCISIAVYCYSVS